MKGVSEPPFPVPLIQWNRKTFLWTGSTGFPIETGSGSRNHNPTQTPDFRTVRTEKQARGDLYTNDLEITINISISFVDPPTAGCLRLLPRRALFLSPLDAPLLHTTFLPCHRGLQRGGVLASLRTNRRVGRDRWSCEHETRTCDTFAAHRARLGRRRTSKKLADVTKSTWKSTHAMLTAETVNPAVREAEYAVRGKIVERSGQLQKELAKKSTDGENGTLPFDSIVACNIGNPQVLGQKPVTFFRQVLAICDYPDLLDNPRAADIFPLDVLDRARDILNHIPGGTGAYSASCGVEYLRKQVAEAIERRDGYPCNYENIFLTDGASSGVHACMRIAIREKNDAILVPIPQYPLYSATLTLYGGTLVPYYLEEDKEWGMNVQHLKAQLEDARSKGLNVRGLVVINPGNPTGQVLAEENQVEVLKFCKEEKMVMLADEVYQENVYAEGKSFTSFKKAMCKAGIMDMQLISFHSISKGYYGECGRRGGYMELVGFPPDVMQIFHKLASISLCSNVNGQICTALMMNPPKKGDPSYLQYIEEKEAILASLKRRAIKLVTALNEMEGISCNPAQGALYAFPSIKLPMKAAEEAKKQGVAPDFYYCMRLLEATGIVTVPGSGFRQKDGSFHFRTTFLPSEADIDVVISRMRTFHRSFMEKYSD